MVRRGVVLALVAVLGLAAAPARDPELSAGLPEGLPAASVLLGWEQIDGAGQHGGEAVRYRLYVDPAHPLLYRITHFGLRHTERAADGTAHRVVEPEIVVWNERPGVRVPLLCFRREPAGVVGSSAGRLWRPVPPGTPDYQVQMVRAMAIYQIQRARDDAAAASVGP